MLLVIQYLIEWYERGKLHLATFTLKLLLKLLRGGERGRERVARQIYFCLFVLNDINEIIMEILCFT